jgi:phosphoribosylformylglycinamidine synthase
MTLDFKQKGDLVFVIGECTDDIGSSEYLVTYHGIQASPAPHFDLQKEYEVQEVVKGLIRGEFINAAHDVSDGGLFVALVEMSIPRNLGFDVVTDSEVRPDAFLFGEGQGRVVVSVSEEQEEAFIEFMMNTSVPYTLLGHVTKGKMVVDDEHFGFIQEAADIYNNALGRILEN